MNQSPDSPPACRVLQFTDSHLLGEPSKTFLGIEPVKTLDAVIELAFRSRPDPDLVLLTGDLSQDSSIAAYRLVEERFAGLGIPIGIIPGNHDRVDRMKKVFTSAGMQVCGNLRLHGWTVMLLNSTVRGKVGGALGPRNLAQLEQSLSENNDQPVLVCLHHQPVPVGTGWLDTIGLDDSDAFLAVVDRYPMVKGVLWGHVHQSYDGVWRERQMMATPSTSIQFKPQTEDFALDPIAPGYRWLELHPDGSICSGVERLDKMPRGLDLKTTGY